MREAGGPDRGDSRNRPLIGCAWPTGGLHGRTASDPTQRPDPNEVDPATAAPSTLRGLDFLCTDSRGALAVHKKNKNAEGRWPPARRRWYRTGSHLHCTRKFSGSLTVARCNGLLQILATGIASGRGEWQN